MADLKLELDDEHPLALELDSLGEAVSRYQHEAHAASVKLQRYALNNSNAIQHAHALEQENARLREELEILRAHPDSAPQAATLQVPELTLALRKLSDKLTLTEGTLLARSIELVHAQSELRKARQERDVVLVAARQVNARVEEGKLRERELLRKAQAAEEETKLANMVLEEYAALVRKLEGRSSNSSSISREGDHSTSQPTPASSFTEGKAGLQRLLSEFNKENERLAFELGKVRSESELVHAQLEAERQRSEADRESLAKIILELDQYRADDTTAAKMVSRYMKFSQSTSDSLQKAMDNLRTRHSSTVSTFNLQIEHLHNALMTERRQNEKLREALDQLSEDLSREAYGRRREIALRLSFLGREETLSENIRRWIRKSTESASRAFSQAQNAQDLIGALRETFDDVLHSAEHLLDTLNGQPVGKEDVLQGSVARIVAAQSAVKRLTRELQLETHLRLQAQSRFANAGAAVEALAAAKHLPDLPMTPAQSSSSVNLHSDQIVSTTVVLRDTPTEVTSHILQERIPTVAQEKQTLPDRYSVEKEPTAASSRGVLSEMVPSEASNDSNTGFALEPSDVLPQSGSENKHASRKENAMPSETPSSSITQGATPVEQEDLTLHFRHLPTVPVVAITTVSDEAYPRATGEVIDAANTDMLQPPLALHSFASETLSPRKLAVATLPSGTTSTSTIQELSGVDICDLPSTSLQETPQPHKDVELAPSTSASLAIDTAAGTPSGMLFKSSPVVSASAHPLIADLELAKERYDSFQRAFRDCNLSLKELKKDTAELPSLLETSAILKAAVERLNDYNEDTRVELEIRVADEERMISGYETLLAVPGAMSDEIDEAELRQEIVAFVEGTTGSVAKAQQQFSRKLEDLQHDIASVKRTIHEISSGELSLPTYASTPPTKSAQGWSSWTGGILGGGRPVSPAPTFGSVMTTPRVRQSSFGSFMHRPSLSNLHERSAADDAAENNSLFAGLNLRIPMPALAVPQSFPSRGFFLSPSVSHTQKPRAASSPMYMLGLGMRSDAYGFPTPSTKGSSRRLVTSTEDNGTGLEDTAGDSDVE
ncbi:hypothetical protein BC835DRAFT_1418520 [Cytidiella melzeri]|nr:hypothetical protein BC835DRAFT_1418520 [Cytidiella melzeri]